MYKDETEEDLYESSNGIAYEETNTVDVNEKISRVSGKHISGIWSIPSSSFMVYPRTISHRFADVLESIASFFRKGIDFLLIFIYNVYYKLKHYERNKKMSKQDNTKSKEDTKKVNKLEYRGWYFNPRNWNWNGIIGLGLFLLVASEIFAAVVIYMGTGKDIVPKVMIAPIAIHAFLILVKVFTSFTSSKGDK